MGEKLSFYKLVSEKNYTIEIPIIQRDYAQGRDSASEIRFQFLAALKKTLSGEKSVELDFIYGSLIKNGSITLFIPLDGQQRLTTLFLLHWYLSLKENRLPEFRAVMLSHSKAKFSYETRTTSRDFCNALISNDISFSDIVKYSVREVITDSNWFFLSWEKDPTIQSMLVMLHEIHATFFKTEGFYDKLVRKENPIICFQFIELENFGLTDSLYVKMNSRGKELTEFENFKAKFEQYLEKADVQNSTNFKSYFSEKIDTDWTDLFWSYRNKETNFFDDKLMNFIRAMVVNNYALIETDPEETESNIEELINGKINFRRYEALKCLNRQCLEDIIETLDHLKNGSNKIKIYLGSENVYQEESQFKKVINDDLSYTDRVLFFSFYKYLIINNGNTHGLYDWLRIIRNLSVNTIYNGADEFIKSIKGITEILRYSSNIVSHLATSNFKIDGFAQVQVLEERIKAKLISKNNEWRNAIIKYEDHKYFVGQIDFILKFSGIKEYHNNTNNLDWDINTDSYYFQQFNEYAEKSAFMFNEDGLNEKALYVNNFNQYFWQRALLSKGDYLLLNKRNKSFLVNYHRDISWKRYLRDDSSKRDFLKRLFDDISIKSARTDLEKIINNDDTLDWRKYFIHRPEVFRALGRDGRFIRWESENDILLLEKSQTNGTHTEYYTYALYTKLQKLGNRVYYTESNSIDYLKFINWINRTAVEISYDSRCGNGWKYNFKVSENNYEYFKTEDEVIEYLVQKGIMN